MLNAVDRASKALQRHGNKDGKLLVLPWQQSTNME